MGRGESGGAGEDFPMEKGLKGAAAAASAAAGDVGLDKNELFEKMLEVRDQANARKRE